MFQSTHPHGVRPDEGAKKLAGIWFQSTHPHGVRRTFTLRAVTLILFQSTHPHGVRHCQERAKLCRTGFNPRTRTGCDSVALLHFTKSGSFNPRTRTGCDCRCCTYSKAQDCFNPRTRTGCDQANSITFHSINVSIHAPARGAT